MDECERRPDYNLLYYNCTHFAIETARQARVKPPSAETMSVPNPNAIFQGIEEEEQAKDQEEIKGSGRAQAFVEDEFVEPANVRWRGGALARPEPRRLTSGSDAGRRMKSTSMCRCARATSTSSPASTT